MARKYKNYQPLNWPKERSSRSWKWATSGTYVDEAIRPWGKVFFSLAVLALLLTPSLGMVFSHVNLALSATASGNATADPSASEEGDAAPVVAESANPVNNATQADPEVALPIALNSDGTFNEGYLQALGDYFDNHFALRNSFITADARLRSLLEVSPTEQVIPGADGWLFYGGTLPDYLGQNRLSDEALAAAAHNLALVQESVEATGAKFIFTLAPNKNSLEWDAMPYYYLRGVEPSNAQRFSDYLQQAGVNYVDLFALFKAQLNAGERFHYLKTDSHWDNYWALLGANAIMEEAGLEKLPIVPSEAVRRSGFVGDLQAMLYPADTLPEDNYFYNGYNNIAGLDDRVTLMGSDAQGAGPTEMVWDYSEGNAVTDAMVKTTRKGGSPTAGLSPSSALEEGEGAPDVARSLLMFRDSFGNALLPFMAAGFGEATFTKLVPYNLTQIHSQNPSCVVIERAERHLSYLATTAPAMYSPVEQGAQVPDGSKAVDAQFKIGRNGGLWQVEADLGNMASLPDWLSVGSISSRYAVSVLCTLEDGTSFTFRPYFQVSDDGNVGILIYAPSSGYDLTRATFKLLAA